MAYNMMYCPHCKIWVFYDTEWDVMHGCCVYCLKRKQEQKKDKDKGRR